jgi:mRNA interferase RelE/StbE
MTYKIVFDKRAEKEWRKLSPDIRSQFSKKLKERAENPKVPSAKLSLHSNTYKIKLRNSGYRLVYKIDDGTIKVMVMAIGKRDRIYEQSKSRFLH